MKAQGDGLGGLPVLAFETPEAWEKWLEGNHGASAGVWLRLAKKASGARSVTYGEALEVALCHGWIDGQKKGDDEAAWLQKFTPRAKRSIWSKVNQEKALALIEAGRMREAGRREVERAQADGRWQAAYDSPKGATVPDDLQAALDGNARAGEEFAKLDSRNRYAVLFRVQTAKKAETRARRIEQFIAMLERGERLHP